MNAEQLIEQLETVRESKNITRYGLAKLTGMPERSVAVIEQNRAAQLKNFIKLADALGLECVLRQKKNKTV